MAAQVERLKPIGPVVMGVTGSRHFGLGHGPVGQGQRRAVSATLAKVKPSRVSSKERQDYPLLVHGAAPGLDQTALVIARALGWESLAVRAAWLEHGPSAGPRRNSLLVRLLQTYHEHGQLVVVHAFPLPNSKGTLDCVRKAVAAGLDVVEHLEWMTDEAKDTWQKQVWGAAGKAGPGPERPGGEPQSGTS